MTSQPADQKVSSMDHKRGMDLLHDPKYNKGTGFTLEERDLLGLRGLLPPRYMSDREQLERVYENYSYKVSPLEKFIYLIGLLDRNETLFYDLLEQHLEEMLPIVYTPTVGLACQKYSRIFRRPRGLCVSLQDRGHVDDILGNWPYRDIRIIVVTDGERILGLGDLGLNGLGIPVGKLTLYVAAAGIEPSLTLPVVLDVGTNNEELRADPLYLGLDQRRERGPAYDELVEEFFNAVHRRWPSCLVQFEDFANANAFRLLEKYRHRGPVFNDDIQGTGAVTLAGILGALRLTEIPLTEQRIILLGAGSAGIGITHSIMTAMQQQGLSVQESRERFWFVDSKGLVTRSRYDQLQPHKKEFARDEEPLPDLLTVVHKVQPTILIGISGRAGLFTEEVVRTMGKHVERPIIFALSNPTANAECTAEQAYSWTDGRAIFASGSPFDPVEYKGKTFHPGQGNNVYIFPGVGFGAITAGAKEITDSMFYIAAMTLAASLEAKQLENGSVYPPQDEIRSTSITIAVEVAREVFRQGLNSVPEPEDIEFFVREQVWHPIYKSYV